MANDVTALKVQRIASRKRAEASDLEDATLLAEGLIEVALAASLARRSGALYGWEIVSAGFRVFSISKGAGLWMGRLVKSVADAEVALDENPSADPRIDLVQINGVTASNTDSATVVTLSAITRTAVAGEAVGTGDGTTKAFDLDHAGVDHFRAFMRVQVDGVTVTNWKLEKGAGTSGVDRIVFEIPPETGLAITADYTWQSGGVDGSSSQATRKTLTPTFSVVKGTPASSPSVPSLSSGAVAVGTIQVPGGWTGGSSGVVISYSSREPVIAHDEITDSYHSHVPQDTGGRVGDAVRHIEQVIHGFRLYYASSDRVRIGPGWGALGGVSFRSTTTSEVTVAAAGTGWHYVYAKPVSLDSGRAGSLPSYEVTTDPPTFRRRTSGSDTAFFYIGCFYVKSTGPTVIRPFSYGSDGFCRFDANPLLDTALRFALATGSLANINIATACPPNGRRVKANLALAITSASTDGMGVEGLVQSHKASSSAYAAAYPRIGASILKPASLAYIQGDLVAEADGSARYIHGNMSELNLPDTVSAHVEIWGFFDDCRTLDGSGSALTY